MPTYEYKCNDCGFFFEEFQSIVSAPLEICPQCHGRIKRMIAGGVGLIFKGNGFYLTDYKNKKNGGDAVKPAEKKDTVSKPKKTEK